MKIAMAQMRVKAAYLDDNLKSMKLLIDQAVLEQADLIVFPEMCVSGYLLSDKYLQQGFVEEVIELNELIKSFSTKIGIIWGSMGLDLNQKNRDGRFERRNQAFFAYQNEWVQSKHSFHDGYYVKHALPDYRIFDDSRYFKSGTDVSLEKGFDEWAMIEPFEFKGLRIGLEVCEDLWSQDYRVDPTELYIKRGADIIINISSSPWTLNKELSRNKRILEHVSTHQEKMIPILYVNACGAQNNGKNVMLFDGGSSVFNKKGEIIASCNDEFRQELKIIDVTRVESIPKTNHKLLKAIVEGIRAFDEEILGKRNWVIGLSGGIDSSVNAALLVLALGKERVFAYNMASRYNSEKTKEMAKSCAHKLEIAYYEGSIESLVKSTHETLAEFGFEANHSGINAENIQARLRGHLLSSFASLKSAVICNNANKVECALGYATLYGDTIGALSPLGDLTKVQIFDLAREINEVFSEVIIPSALIPNFINQQYVFELAPSAELREAQIDPMKWGYHDYLVQYLTQYPSHSIDEFLDMYESGEWKKLNVASIMKAYGLDQAHAFIADLRWFMKAYHLAIFKRIQFPPIIAVSRASFGYDYRESQIPYLESDKMKAQIQRILEKKD